MKPVTPWSSPTPPAPPFLDLPPLDDAKEKMPTPAVISKASKYSTVA